MVTLQRRQNNHTRSSSSGRLPVIEDDEDDIVKEIQYMQIKSEMKRIEDLDCWTKWKYMTWVCFGCAFIPYTNLIPQNNNTTNEWRIDIGWRLNVFCFVAGVLIHCEHCRRIDSLKDAKIVEIGRETYTKIKYVYYGLVMVSYFYDDGIWWSYINSLICIIIAFLCDIKSGRRINNAGAWIRICITIICCSIIGFVYYVITKIIIWEHQEEEEEEDNK